MKNKAFILIVCLALILFGCNQKSNGNMTTNQESNSKLIKDDAEMTETAKKLGITFDEYPEINGSTSTLKIVQGLWSTFIKKGSKDYDKYFPKTALKTVPSYKKLISGEVDLIFVPYASKEILDEAKSKDVKLEFTKISGEALIFITPKENRTDNITNEQVKKIYLENAIRNWKELNGPDKKLIPICRNSDSGSQSLLDNMILDNKPIEKTIKENYVSLTMEDLLYQVAYYHNGGANGETTNTYALGYTLYGYLKNEDKMTGIGDSLKILSFNGVNPTPESIADGSYELSDGYYAVTTNKLPKNHNARKIVEYFKSGQAKNILEKAGMQALDK